MKIIRSYQTTAITSATDAIQALMDGPNNSKHINGLIIPPNSLAPGDYIRLKAFIRGTPGDDPSDTLEIVPYFDNVQLVTGGAMDIDPDADFGAFIQWNYHLGNDGKLYSMYVVPGIVDSTPDFVSANATWGEMQARSYLDPAVLVPLVVQSESAIPTAANGFKAADAVLPLGIAHNFIITGKFGTAEKNSTAQLVSCQIEIIQPLNGNTAGE